MAVIGLCGGEVELSGVRIVSLRMFHLGAGDDLCGCWFCLGVCFVCCFFFCCIAELAIKPCRSSRSELRGEFGIPRHLQNRKQKHNQATKKQQNKHKTKNRQVLECETRGEKRVKRPKRPNALICRTPGGSVCFVCCWLGCLLCFCLVFLLRPCTISSFIHKL